MTAKLRAASLPACVFLLVALLVGCGGDGENPRPDTSSAGKREEKDPIDRIDDLPPHRFPIDCSAVELLDDPEKLGDLADRVLAKIEADLDRYDIRDTTTLQGMYAALELIHNLRGEHDEALACLDRSRDLEDSESRRLAQGLVKRAIDAARRETGEKIGSPRFRESFRIHLSGHLSRLSWESAQDIIQQSKGLLEIYSRKLILGVAVSEIEPAVAGTGELNTQQATRILAIENLFREVLPLKEEIIAVYQAAIESNRAARPDIWSARSCTFDGAEGHAPVLVGVWDTGTDCPLFEGNLFENGDERIDGRDTDGNGFVDDVHGIAWDAEGNPSPDLLLPLGEAEQRLPLMLTYLKGLLDLQAAIDSPDTPPLKKYIAGLEPADVGVFVDDLRQAGAFVQGTHTAGIVVAGNPFARILPVRITFDARAVPRPFTPELAQRLAASWRKTVSYFRESGVRIVNISWAITLPRIEASLELNGIGASAEARREMARESFSLMKQALLDSIGEAEEILFVCAAGNTNTDVEFVDTIPSSFELPNLLVVGAVDQAGEPAFFTSYGLNVEIYANGFEVEGVIPGGGTIRMSGTTVASPHVTNLAGKLLSVKPDQTPQEVINVIRRGADLKEAGSSAFLLLNPKKSLEILEASMTGN